MGDNDKVIFNVQFEDNKIDLTSEQVLAALFTKIAQILALNNIAANDCVVSVPSFFTVSERESFINSAALAGIKILRVYNESTANVMNYGIFRKSDLHLEKERLVGFLDFGHSKTSLFIAKIWKNKAEIIDENMMNYYINVFEKKNNLDLRESKRSVYRLLSG